MLLGDDLQKKIREAEESSKLTSNPLSQLPLYTGHQNQKGCGQANNNFFVSEQQTQSTTSPKIQKLTNKEQDIAHNTKTTDNTGINKHSKYKAFRHTIYQGIIQIQEQ